MKKVLLLIVFYPFFIFSSSVNAQVQHGKFLVGMSSNFGIGNGSSIMSLGFSTQTYKSDADGFSDPKSDKSVGFNLVPKVGYFVNDFIVVGLDIYSGFLSQEDGDSGDKNTLTIMSVGPFARFYMSKENVRPFFELNSSFGTVKEKYKYEGGSDDSSSNLRALGAGFGIAAPLGDRVTFDVMIDYSSVVVKVKNDNPDNNRVVNGTLGIKLGFVVFLGGN